MSICKLDILTLISGFVILTIIFMTKIIFFIQCVQVMFLVRPLKSHARMLRCWLFFDARCFCFFFFGLRLRLFETEYYFSWKNGVGLSSESEKWAEGKKLTFSFFFFFFWKFFFCLCGNAQQMRSDMGEGLPEFQN